MSENNNKTTSRGVSWAFMLFIVFLVLKLTKTITWSWWLVTLPIWGGLALGILFIIIAAIVALIAVAIYKEKNL
jgi:hypothetical protein